MKFRTKFVAVALGVLSAVLLNASSSQAATTWDAVKKKIEGCKDYSLTYAYNGPKGKFNFEYVYIASPMKVRTKILRGSDRNVGTVTIYDKDKDANTVAYRVGSSQLKRSLDHKDVTGTAFYQGVYTLVLSNVKGATPKVSAGETMKGKATTLFEFNVGAGGTYKIWATDDGDIVQTQKIEGAKVTEERKFSDIKWDSNPSTAW